MSKTNWTQCAKYIHHKRVWYRQRQVYAFEFEASLSQVIPPETTTQIHLKLNIKSLFQARGCMENLSRSCSPEPYNSQPFVQKKKKKTNIISWLAFHEVLGLQEQNSRDSTHIKVSFRLSQSHPGIIDFAIVAVLTDGLASFCSCFCFGLLLFFVCLLFLF